MASNKKRPATVPLEAFARESDLHRLVLRAIKADKISTLIADDAGLLDGKHLPRENMFPRLSIDHLCRMSAIRAGQKVLRSLSQLQLLTSDKNISISRNDVLRPDLVCINPEQESIVLIELKKSAQSGRQALQELLAYEQELKNTLPFLSKFDCNFVLISSEWSSLMDHAAMASITWSHQRLLCLHATMVKRKLSLRTRVPEAWKITGSSEFPEDAMPCVTLCLYGYESKPRKKGLDSRLLISLDIIARYGEKSGSSGFAVLWKDHSKVSVTEYNITIVGVAPFALYRAGRGAGTISVTDGTLVSHLDDFVRTFDPAGHSESLMRIATSANPVLSEISTPTLEGFSHWDAERVSLCTRADPILTESWGLVGDFMRDYVLHPAIRKHRRNTIGGGLWGWRDPRVALPLVQGFMRPALFSDGDVRCADAFRLGVLIGLDRIIRVNLKSPTHSDDQNLKCRFLWNRMDLMAAVDEIRLLADSAENVQPPKRPLKFFDDPLVDDDASFEDFHSWITSQFLQNSGMHIAFLMAGANGALVFDVTDQWGITANRRVEILRSIERELRLCTLGVLSLFARLRREKGMFGELPSMYKALRRTLGLSIVTKESISALSLEQLFAGWDLCMRSADRLIDPVFHRHAPLAVVDVDWTWLRQGIREARERGKDDIGVVLLPNGTLATGSVFPEKVFKDLMVKPKSDDEVYFLDRSRGIGIVRLVTWDALKTGLYAQKVQGRTRGSPKAQAT